MNIVRLKENNEKFAYEADRKPIRIGSNYHRKVFWFEGRFRNHFM